MADRYWVGGTGTWNTSTTTNWSATSGGAGGASAPTNTDNVFFDANSTPTPGVAFTVTLSSANCLNFTLTTSDFQTFGGTVFADGSVSANSATNTSNMTIEMRSSVAQTVDVRIPLLRLRFNGTGTFDLTFDLTQTTILDLTRGTITSSTGALWYARNFVSSSISTRAVAAGVSIQLTGTGRTDLWVASGGTFTCDGQIFLSDFNNTFAGGGFTYAFLYVTSGSGTLTITGNNTFRQFTGDNQGGSILSFPSGGTTTIGSFFVSGSAINGNTTVRSASGTTTLVFRRKPKGIDYLTFQGVTASPSGLVYAGANSVDNGGNSGINFSAWVATDFYWISGTGDWTDGTDQVLPNYLNWSNSSGGAAYAAPSPGDNVYFDANSDAGTSFTVTRAASIFVNVFSILGIDQAMSFSAGTSTFSITGNFTLTNTGLLSWSSTGIITFGWVSGTNVINTDFFPLTNGITFTAAGGSWQLASPFQTSSTAVTTLTSGTLSLQNYSYDTGSFTSSNSNVRSINFGTGSITLYNSGTIWNTATTTNLSISGTPLVASAYSGISPRVITPGALAEASTISFWFLSGGGTVTITAASGVKSLDFNGFTGTLANTAISIYGGLQLSSAMTLTAGSSVWTFAATSGSWTITSNGKIMDFPLTFFSNGAPGTWVLGDALTTGATRTTTLTRGSLDLAGYSLTTGLFSSTSSNVRSIAFGAGNITVAGTGTVWNTGTGTNLTTTGTQLVRLTNATATARTITPGTLSEANSISFNVTAGTGTVSLTASSTVRSLNFTGFSGSHTAVATTFYGSLVFSTGMTLTGAAVTYTFGATSGSHLITTNGKTLTTISTTINGAPSTATYTLGSAFTSTGSAGFTLVGGTFNTAGFAFTAASFIATGAATRTALFNASTVTITSSGSVFNIGSVASNLTFNAGTSTITLSGNAVTFTTGDQNFYDVSFTSSTGGTGVGDNIVGASSFRNLSFAGVASGLTYLLSLSADQTVTGTFTLGAGANATQRRFVRSTVLGSPRTLTCAAVSSLSDIDFRDITIAGAAAPVSGTRLGDCKGNSGITFPAPKTVFYRNATSSNWNAAWSFTNGGASDATAFPLAQDTAVFPSSPTPFPSSGNTITFTAAYNVGTIDMSARTTNTMTLATGTQTPSIYGNWINGTGTTLTGTGTLTFSGRGSQTITSAGRSFTQPITTNSPGGSVTLQDAFVSSLASGYSLTLSSGTFDAAGYNVTGLAFNFTGNATRTAALGSGTWTATGVAAGNSWQAESSANLTVTGTGTISLTSSGGKFFRGGGIQTYPTINQGGSGILTIFGSNKFADITDTSNGSIFFNASVTSTLYGMAWSGSAYVVGTSTGGVLVSSDGLIWRSYATNTTGGILGMAWSGSLFAAVGSTGVIQTSASGTSWTQQTSGTTSAFNAVVWTGAQFVAVGNAGAVLTSPDGVTWTSQTSGTALSLFSVTWNGSLLVAVGGTGVIITSPDGVTWTVQVAGSATTLLDVTNSGSLFVAVGSSGVVLTSPTGTTWTSQTSGVAVTLNSVAWTGSLFAAVGSTGTIITSPTGVTWTAQTSGVTSTLASIEWLNSKAYVGGINGTLLVSSNATSWIGISTGYTEFSAFNLNGAPGTPLVIGSSQTGVQQVLVKPTAWLMGANSTDGGNNTGLSFTSGGGIDYLSVSYINGVVVTPFILAYISESASASSTESPIGTYNPAISELATSSEAGTATGVLLGTLSESATIADAIDATRAFYAAVVEAATVAEVVSAARALAALISESAQGQEAAVTRAILNSLVPESATVLDAEAGLVRFTGSVAEAAAAAESFLAALSTSGRVAEFATVQDIAAVAASTFSAASAETARPLDTPQGANTGSSSLSESAAASESTASAFTAVTSVAEAATGSETGSSLAVFGGSIAELALGLDAVLVAPSTFSASAAEVAMVMDLLDAPGSVYNVAMAESAVVADALDGAYLWNLVDDSQTPNWQNVVVSQTPGWVVVDDSQTTDWTNVQTWKD